VQLSQEDSPWASINKGGGAVLMKQLFTVTKGRRRHAFLHTAFKATLLADAVSAPSVVTANSIADLLTRAWDPAMLRDSKSDIDDIAARMANAMVRNVSFSQGGAAALPHLVQQETIELLTAGPECTQDWFTFVQVVSVNVTIVCSDTLPAAVAPLEGCDKYFQNLAVGGRAIGTDCYKAFGNDQTGAHFLGQVDTAAMFILNGFLARRGANSSASALDTAAHGWLRKNAACLDGLVLTRAYIMAIHPRLVMLKVSSVRPAMSYLQLLLVLLASIAAALSFGAVTVFASGHYRSSLLANLVAMAHDENQPKLSQNTHYLWRVPDIVLGRESARVVMGNNASIYRMERLTSGYLSGRTAKAQPIIREREVMNGLP
jgi:hypothetical protein